MRRTKIYLYVLVGFILIFAYKGSQWKKVQKEYTDCMKKYKAK